MQEQIQSSNSKLSRYFLHTSDWEMAGLLADDTVLPKLDIDWVPMKEDLAYSEYLED
jgi:hypothetical protein